MHPAGTGDPLGGYLRSLSRMTAFPAEEALPALIQGSELVVVKDGPHNILWTFPDEVNTALLNFLKQ